LSQVQSQISALEADLAEMQAVHIGVTEARTRLDAARAERASLEQRFHRQAGARTAALEEARNRVRARTLAVAQRAALDRGVLGPEFDAAREAVAAVELEAAAATREALVHEAALESYDASSVRRGMWVAALLLVVLVVAPVVWRAVRVVEPPVPTGVKSSRSAQGAITSSRVFWTSAELPPTITSKAPGSTTRMFVSS